MIGSLCPRHLYSGVVGDRHVVELLVAVSSVLGPLHLETELPPLLVAGI